MFTEAVLIDLGFFIESRPAAKATEFDLIHVIHDPSGDTHYEF